MPLEKLCAVVLAAEFSVSASMLGLPAPMSMVLSLRADVTFVTIVHSAHRVEFG